MDILQSRTKESISSKNCGICMNVCPHSVTYLPGKNLCGGLHIYLHVYTVLNGAEISYKYMFHLKKHRWYQSPTMYCSALHCVFICRWNVKWVCYECIYTVVSYQLSHYVTHYEQVRDMLFYVFELLPMHNIHMYRIVFMLNEPLSSSTYESQSGFFYMTKMNTT